jgi:GMP reductase
MKIEDGIKLDFSDVLFRPKRSTLASRKEVSLDRSFKFTNYEPDFPENIEDYHYNGVPIMAANMDGVGTFEMAKALGRHAIFTCLVKTYTVDELVEFFASGIDYRYVAMSIGSSDADFNKLVEVYNKTAENLKYVCMDVANGYSEHFSQQVKKVREAFPHIVIIAGNVVTADMTQELILNGADIVKVGIGPGSVCTTRIQTGVGYPQLSAIMDCADAAHGLGGLIIADGGCTCPGDVAKAFGAGADFVMLGGMLAGHDEGGGEIITKIYNVPYTFKDRKPVVELKSFVQFYGMSSETAMHKHHGGVADYRSSEGRTVEIPYKGPVENTVKDILGGIRSTCTYVGASELKHLSKCTTFIRVNNQFNNVFANTK